MSTQAPPGRPEAGAVGTATGTAAGTAAGTADETAAGAATGAATGALVGTATGAAARTGRQRRLALVTGGTSGIGRAVAAALAGRFDLALGHAADHERAAAAREALAAAAPEARIELFPRRLDDAAGATALVAEVRERFGADPAVLVHCAGGVADRLFLEGPLEEPLRLLGEHLVAGMALAHTLVPAMARGRWGRVVFLSSIGARWVKRGQTGYAAAKAGLEGFSRALALEVAHRGVTVNAVAPGLVETALTAPLLAAWSASGERLRHRIPAGRAGRPEEVAALVAFLCSEEAGYVTGTVHTIDGGRSLGDPAS